MQDRIAKMTMALSFWRWQVGMEMEIAHGWPGYSDLTAGPPYQEGDKALGQLTRD